MKRSVRSFLMLIVLSFLAFSVSGQQFTYSDALHQEGLKIASSDNQSITLTHSIRQFSLEDFAVRGENMKNISFGSSFLPTDEGQPNIPSVSRYVIIPNGATATATVSDIRTEVVGNTDIAPSPNIPLESDASPLRYEKNSSIYSKNSYFPAEIVKVSEPITVRGVTMVMVSVNPFRYNPVKKELEVIRDLSVKLDIVGGNGVVGEERLRSRFWDPIIGDMVLNPEALPTVDYSARVALQNNSAPDVTGAEYLIITATNADYLKWADTIRRWRTMEGISTVVKTITEVGGNTTTALENYLNNAYNTWTPAPAACLLIGDFGTDGTVNIISPIYNSYCASDNILGDVDGNHLPDIVMARLTCNNATEIATMVSKGINYERNPPMSPYFYSHPITALGWQDDRWFQICSEIVGGFFANSLNKTVVRINALGSPASNYTNGPWSTATNTSTVMSYFGPSGLNYIPTNPGTLGGFTGGNATMVNNAINSGSFLLQHRDHGMETGWGEPSYTNSNISGLTNTDLTFIFSVNCLTGKFNYGSESFAEKFHRYKYNNLNSGALGLIAATEVSYSFVNDTYVWGLFDNMWPQFMPSYSSTPAERGLLPAFANAAGKYFLQQSSWPYNTSNKEVTYHLFHMHGDAFLRLFSEVPQVLTVTHNPVLFAGMTSFDITANQGATICLTVNGNIIAVATATGVTQSITIPGQVPPDDVVVTVTKQNYKRYKAVVDVIPAAGPYVVYQSCVVNDASGNNNASLDFGENVLLNVGLKNVGLAQATSVVATISTSSAGFTITDNSETYGNMDPDQLVVKPGAFAVTAANNIVDQTPLAIQIAATSGATNWTSNFTLMANAPVLAFGNMTVNDSGPGCNNDGILDPGETANLVFAISNTGHAATSAATITLGIVGGTSTFLTLNSTTANIASIAAQGTANATFSVTANPTTPIGTPVNLTVAATAGAYTANASKQVVIGLIPSYNINSTTTVTTCVGNFYDSGGEANGYQNSENYTITFNPGGTNNKMKVTFSSFSTESGYDFLKIYNGPTSASPLVGSYSGSSLPPSFTSTHASGAITFVFTSDGTQTSTGWAASIQCIGSGPSPVTNFSANQTAFCNSGIVAFTDQTTNTPTAWSWNFPGATPSTSTQQNPTVNYTTPGVYDVTLTTTNTYGSNTMTKAAYINVNTVPAAPTTPTGETMLCQNPVNTTYTTTAVIGNTYTWELTPSTAGVLTPNGASVTVDWNNTFLGDATLRVKATSTCGTGSFSSALTINVSLAPLQPSQPTGPSSVCQGVAVTEFSTQQVNGATSYAWTITPAEAGTTGSTWIYATVTWNPSYTGQVQISVKAISSCGESLPSSTFNCDVIPAPIAYNITGGGQYCENSGGVEVGLNGSELATEYFLYLNDVNTGTSVSGTGSSISFGNQTQAGTYSARSLKGSCEGNMNGTVPVSIKPLAGTPAQPTGPSVVEIPEITTSTFETTGGANALTYAWRIEPSTAGAIDGTSTTGLLTWNMAFEGNAEVMVAAINECGQSEWSTVHSILVDNTVGVEDLTSNGLKVYPVPATDFIIIERSNSMKSESFTLYDIKGNVVMSGKISGAKATLDVQGLSQGSYILHIENHAISRIVIQK